MMKIKTVFLLAASVGILFFSACGDDESILESLPERVVGTWVQTRAVIDCEDDEQDALLEFVCDDTTCRQIILGQDSTFTSISINNGNMTTLTEFYLFQADILTGEVENRIEICDGKDFNRECNREFDIALEGNTLKLTQIDEDNCVNTIEYIRSE